MRFLFFAALFLAYPLQARVLDLHAEIRVAKSGEVTVTERITLEGGENAKGLERALPRAARVDVVTRGGDPEGRQLYQVTYRAAARIAFHGDHDAIYWNLAGGERMTAEVILPASVPARQIKAEASGGAYWSFVREGRAAFRAAEPIALVVRFPKGVVAEPADYYGILLVIALLAFTAWVLHVIRGQGRNSAPERDPEP